MKEKTWEEKENVTARKVVGGKRRKHEEKEMELLWD